MTDGKDLKIVFLGSSSVGKTSLIQRFCSNIFLGNQLATIGAGFLSHAIKINDKTVTLLLWDTAGEERFRAVAPCLLHGADGIIIVYDITNIESFKDVDIYYNMVMNVVNFGPDSSGPILLLGNKSDLSQQLVVPEDDVKNWSADHKIMHNACVSAKTGDNVKEAIEEFVRLILDVQRNAHESTIAISFNEEQRKTESGCC